MNPEMSAFTMLVILWQSVSDILDTKATGIESASDSSWDVMFTFSRRVSKTCAKHS
jgi:hypothetical protein